MSIFWLLSGCFDADSNVYIIEKNNLLNIKETSIDLKYLDEIVNDIVIKTQLRNVNVGDWILSVNPYTNNVMFI